MSSHTSRPFARGSRASAGELAATAAPAAAARNVRPVVLSSCCMVMLPCDRAAREIVAEFIAPPPEPRKPIPPRAWLLTSPAHTRYGAALTAEPRHPIPVTPRDQLLLRGDGRLLRAARLDRVRRRRGHAALGLGRPTQGSDTGLDVDRPHRRRHPSGARPRLYRLGRHGAPVALGADRHRDRALRLHRP